MALNGGIARLPAAAVAAGFEIELAENATLRVEGGSRQLSGTIDGLLDLVGGNVYLSNVTGMANISIDKNATVVFEGDGRDSNVTMENRDLRDWQYSIHSRSAKFRQDVRGSAQESNSSAMTSQKLMAKAWIIRVKLKSGAVVCL